MDFRSRAMPKQPVPALIGSLALAASLCAAPLQAAEPKPPARTAAAPAVPRVAELPAPSALDAELFYQLFLAETELRQGEPGTAYQIMLETARRQRSEQLFKRAADIALGARAGEQALAATKAWRQALPKSRQAVELQSQILLALGRTAEAAEPLKVFLELTPAAERSGAIASVPRLLTRDGKRDAEAAPMFDKLLEPWRSDGGTRLAALVATARVWLAAGESGRALDLARAAQKADASAEGPALIALELMGTRPEAESLVTQYLDRRRAAGSTGSARAGDAKAGPHAEVDALAVVELAYARRLTASQRFADALGQARAVTARSPTTAEAWLLQGALQIEMADPKAAQASLLRFV
jgi:tetratricopeptide (TPR) repeat protein